MMFLQVRIVFEIMFSKFSRLTFCLVILSFFLLLLCSKWCRSIHHYNLRFEFSYLHPRKPTWNPKMKLWFRCFSFFNWMIFRFQPLVSQGGTTWADSSCTKSAIFVGVLTSSFLELDGHPMKWLLLTIG